jgi:Ni,Fe-hydrogenase maturation factor
VDPSSIVSEDISTHRIPLSALVKYLEAEIACRVSILGIQPASMDLGSTLSPSVCRAGKRLSRVLFRSLRSPPPPP